MEKKYGIIVHYILCFLLSFLFIFIASLYNYLFFHALAEIFSIIIAFTIYIIFLNIHNFIKNGFFVIIGISFLFIGFFDILHTLSYTGMNIFYGYDTNLTISFWIVGRLLESLIFLLAFFFIKKNFKKHYYYLFLLIISITLLILIFSNNFPIFYIEEKGLTNLKIFTEFFICIIFVINLYLAYKNRKLLENEELFLLMSAFVCIIFSELFFTLYKDPYGTQNLIGHYLKIISYFLIYRSLVVKGLRKPYDQLVENTEILKNLVEEKTVLLREIHHRVKNNLQNIISIIKLQTMYVKDTSDKEMFLTIEGRIQSIGVIHELFYQTYDLKKIPFNNYLVMLTQNISSFFPNLKEKINIIIQANDIYFDLNKAVPLGLIMNEIITNSFKHAFNQRDAGEIKININLKNSDSYEIRIEDNGCGFPSDFDIKTKKTLGMELIQSLGSQLDATIDIESNISKGTFYYLKIGV